MLVESTVSGSTETPDAMYSYHPQYIDAVAVRMRSSDAHIYLHDANFNVTALVDYATSNVVERYAYTPYGVSTVLDADFSADADGKSDVSNEYLYTGRRLDPATGLQLNRNRFYAAGLGRWVNRDPIGYAAGDMNLYGYVGGMPTYYVDPSGHVVFCCAAAGGYALSGPCCAFAAGAATGAAAWWYCNSEDDTWREETEDWDTWVDDTWIDDPSDTEDQSPPPVYAYPSHYPRFIEF